MKKCLRRFLLTLVLLCRLPHLANAAAFTSKASGNWSSSGQTTWNEVGVPGNGDTVTITHAIAVDTNTTIGTSPAEGNTVVAASANITVSSGVTLTLRGDMTLANSKVTMDAGSSLVFDASAAGTPASQNYKVQIATAAYQNNAVFDCNGTSGSPVTISSNAGGGNGYFGTANPRGGSIQADYTHFTSVGTAALDAAAPIPDGTGQQPFFKNCRFLNCGPIGANTATAMGGAATYEIEDCSFIGGLGTYDLYYYGFNAYSAGTRSIQRNAFGVGVYVDATNVTFDDNVVGATCGMNDTRNPSSYDGNFIYRTTGEFNLPCSSSNNYLFNTLSTNPHGVQVGTKAATVTHSGWVVDFSNYSSGDVGDAFLASGGAPSGAVVNIQNCIVTLGAAGVPSGTLGTLLGDADLTWHFTHNTACVEVVAGETYNSHAGMIGTLKSNIFSSSSGTRYKFTNINGSQNADVVTAANANYNTGYGLTAGSEGKGYNATITGSPGANDIDEDPGFVAPTRNIATWDASLGGPGTAANAVTELFKLNSSGHNASYTVANLYAYVQAGFVVTNQNLENAGHDGVTIGAMGYEAAGSPLLLMNARNNMRAGRQK